MSAAIEAGVFDESIAGVFIGTENPRQLRILAALMRGDVPRERADRVSGSSNGPEVIRALRKRGLPAGTCLLCREQAGIDIDGCCVKTGVYSLTEEGKRRVYDWLSRRGPGAANCMAVFSA